jgi:hypothetical protein
MGATKTAVEKDFHLRDVFSEVSSTCSVADIHDLPTELEEANRRLPTPAARLHSDRASCDARPAMAADNTEASGNRRKTSWTTSMPYLRLISPTKEGASKANAEAVVARPTQSGRIALTLSALAKIASASAAATKKQ